MSWNEQSETPKPTLRYFVRSNKLGYGQQPPILQELQTIIDPDGFITGTKWVDISHVYEVDSEGLE